MYVIPSNQVLLPRGQLLDIIDLTGIINHETHLFSTETVVLFPIICALLFTRAGLQVTSGQTDVMWSSIDRAAEF